MENQIDRVSFEDKWLDPQVWRELERGNLTRTVGQDAGTDS